MTEPNYTKGVTTRLYLGHHGCGCFIFKEDGKVFIEYCPKHKAAPDLYEALKQAKEWIHLQVMVANEVTDYDEATYLKAKEALAKVESK